MFRTRAKYLSQIEDNSTLPTTISSITILGANKTRRDFLERIVNPIRTVNQNQPSTLADVHREVSIAANKLHKLGIS